MSSALITGTVPAGRSHARREGAVRAWLIALACLVVAMVAIGGATRLTGSGLSITEWKPVTGAVPPLSDAAWTAEFEKYRASSQYQNLNRGMEIAEFKTIYWWEWSHRQLGRFIGLVFFLPLVAFWASGALSGRRATKLLAIGALGGLQATVGWIMVASGLEPGMTAVAPLKLTIHLLLASAILSLLVWEASSPERPATQRSRGFAMAVLALLFVQIALGGLVAGAKAGLTYNTWPLMDGRLVPEAANLFAVHPLIENFVDNPALVQFNHRFVAYLVLAALLWQAWRWARSAPGTPGARRTAAIAGLGLVQAGLGIVTLLLAVPLWAGLSHQLVAMALIALSTHHARAVSG